ncbi:MAG TPA: DUF6285 domain-containing protein [Tepidiformaceae bacterium]
MQDRPNASELLEALGEFMRDRSENARDRWERFQFIVAANSIGILKREFELEDEFMRAEWQGLDDLIGPDPIPDGQHRFAERLQERNNELVQAIKAGTFDDGPAEDRLVRHLYETVVNKVRIASPNEAPASAAQ